MKNLLYMFIIGFTLGCNNNKPGNEKNTAKADSTPSATDTTNGKPKTLDEIKTGLENLVPNTEDQMKALFPQQLLGHEKSETDITNSMGAIAANTEYKFSDTSSVTVLIVDCAGSGGSGFFNMHYINAVGEDFSADNSKVKSSEYKGHKAYESCPGDESDSPKNKNCLFYFFDGYRYLVTLSGVNTGIELLKNAAGEIKLNSN